MYAVPRFEPVERRSDSNYAAWLDGGSERNPRQLATVSLPPATSEADPGFSREGMESSLAGASDWDAHFANLLA